MNKTYREYGVNIDLTKEVSAIMNIFKCLTEEEIEDFFPSDDYSKTKVKGNVLYQVDTQRSLLYGNGGQDHNIVINSQFREYSQKMIDLAWVFLDEVSKNSPEKDTFLAHKKCVTAEYPSGLGYIIKNKLFKFTYLDSLDDLSKVLLSQENFYGRGEGVRGKESESYTYYVFVTRNTKILEGMEDLEISIPHKIALLKGDIHERPTIKYFLSES